MEAPIQDLVNMRDIDSLFEVMTENDDWMLCMDAAEGLILLGDTRGVQFLQDATESDDEDICSVAREILASPAVNNLREEAKNSKQKVRQQMVETARNRLAQGKKVYKFKTVYLSATEFADLGPDEESKSIPGLEDLGLDGWQVAAFVAPQESGMKTTTGRKLIGGYFLLQKEISLDEVAEFEEF